MPRPVAPDRRNGWSSGRKHQDNRLRFVGQAAARYRAAAAYDVVRGSLGSHCSLRGGAGRRCTDHANFGRRPLNFTGTDLQSCVPMPTTSRRCRTWLASAIRRPGLQPSKAGAPATAISRRSLSSPDAMMAILNSGDAATIEFDAAKLPARSARHNAHVDALHSRLDQGGRPEFAADRRVEPLPDTGRLDRQSDVDWQLEYNTRWVPMHVDQTMQAIGTP